MLCFGGTFDENSVPPWTRGDFRGGWECCPAGLPEPVVVAQSVYLKPLLLSKENQ